MAGYGQTKPKLTKADSDTIQLASSNFQLSYQDTIDELFSFRMTGDTSKLKPIDSAYYTSHNEIHRTIIYQYIIEGIPKYVSVTHYYEHNTWIFFGFQLVKYKREDK
jgi:hypothetical protein